HELAVIAPATGEALGRVPALDAAAVRSLVERARAAQPAWSALSVRRRARVLDAYRRVLAAHAEELADLSCREAGKLRFEVVRAARAEGARAAVHPERMARDQARVPCARAVRRGGCDRAVEPSGAEHHARHAGRARGGERGRVEAVRVFAVHGAAARGAGGRGAAAGGPVPGRDRRWRDG